MKPFTSYLLKYIPNENRIKLATEYTKTATVLFNNEFVPPQKIQMEEAKRKWFLGETVFTDRDIKMAMLV